MKYIYSLLIIILFCIQSQAQEIISETSEYVAYQDSLFVLKNTLVTNQGIEGINDTIVSYAPPALDSIGLVALIATNSINDLNTAIAKFRRALSFRSTLSRRNKVDLLLNRLGRDLDAVNVAQYANEVKGRYRITTDSTDFIVDVVDHPNDRFLRAKGTEGEGSFNVRVFGKWMIGILIGGKYNYVIWDGLSRTRPVFRSPNYWISTTMSGCDVNPLRLIKLQ